MRIKSLAQGENILMLRFEPATFVSKIDILTTTPIVHNAIRYASNALPVKRRQSSHLWYDNPELDNARRQVQSCTEKYGVSSRQYADTITNMEALHASAAAKAASEIIDEIGLHTEQCKPAAAWRAINRLTGRKFKPFNCLSAASIADRKRQLTNHYSAILNSQHNEQLQHYRLPYSQKWQQRNSIQESAPFTTTEIRAALRTSRNDTSPGLDEIPNRVLRIPELEGEVKDMLNRHSKALNNENTIPDDWRKSVIVSMPKKGNSTALDNQRGIAKTCSSAKLFNKVLLSRLKPIIDPQLSQCQSGFRAGRSTTEQLMALRCVIDTCRVTNMTASLVVVVVVDPTPPTCCQQSPAPEIMWQPAVSPPRWQGKAPLCRDSSRGPG